MLSNPAKGSRVPMVPGPALDLGKEAPVIARVLVLHEDADSVLAWQRAQVLNPDQRHEMRSSAVHDGHVRQYPVVVVCLQPLDEELKIRPILPRAHHVVGESCADLRRWHPRRILQQWVEVALAALTSGQFIWNDGPCFTDANIIQVDVDSAVVL